LLAVSSQPLSALIGADIACLGLCEVLITNFTVLMAHVHYGMESSH